METSSKFLPELVTAVVSYLPLSGIASATGVCSSWSSAISDNDFWHGVLQRRWLLTDPTALGVSFPTGWKAVCRCFCTMKDEWRPPPYPDQQEALKKMSAAASQFLFGIAHGYMPCADNLFTYHCNGATPIHYRHCPGTEPPEYSQMTGLRLGGRWEWSPDREAWFSTDTCSITRGLFASGGWQLVADNMNIVNFLHQWPLVPLILREIPLQQAANLRSQGPGSRSQLNSKPLQHFLHAVGSGPRPTTSCVATKAFTIHFHFLPALMMSCTPQGWQMTEFTRSKVAHGYVDEFENLMNVLKHRRAGTDFDGISGRPLPPLSDYVHQYEIWFYQRHLGLQ